MAAKGTKQQEGKPAKKTVMCLKPITYSMELKYLGGAHVTKTASYNCTFAVDDGASPPVAMASDSLVPTLVSGTAAGNDNLAAKPMGSGGTCVAPAGETTRRIVITDIHTPRLADKATVRNSHRAEYYRQRGWLKDVRPALPFRMIIRRWVGDVQIPVKDALKLIAEVKDPPEEFSQTDGRPKTFMEEFFKKYNHTTGTASVGDDNQQTWGEAATAECRTHTGNPGYPATHVLRNMPWKKWAMGTDVASFGELTAATAKGTVDAEFDPETKEETHAGGKDNVFVRDMVFYPFPSSGDNYRFLFWLERGGQDIRTQKENGVDIKVYDSADAELKSPWGYLTGKFTIWRRIPLKMIVLVNKLEKEAVDWDIVNSKYRKMFTEIKPPPSSGYYSLTEKEWLKILKDHFDPAGTKYVRTRWLAVLNQYDKHFYPPFLRDKEDDAHTHPLSRAIIAHACAKSVPVITSPVNGGDDDQNSQNGIFVCMMRKLTPDHSDLGEFVYDRQLNVMVHSDVTPLQQCRTIAHEIGHAVTLRHATTKSARFQLNGANIQLIYHNEGEHQLRYHDPNHTLECLMAYTGVDDAHYCGLCSLIVRFYPVHKMVDGAAYGDTAMNFYSGGGLYELDSDGGSVATDIPAPCNLTVGDELYLIALGPNERFNPRWSQATNIVDGRVLLTNVPGSAWTANNTRVTVAAGDRSCTVTGARVGNSRVKYKINNVEFTCNITVVP